MTQGRSRTIDLSVPPLISLQREVATSCVGHTELMEHGALRVGDVSGDA